MEQLKLLRWWGIKTNLEKLKYLGLAIQKPWSSRGVVNNITQTIQSIQQAVEEAKVVGKEINEVVVGIAGQHIRTSNTVII